MTQLIALVIGNIYSGSQALKNPANDATDMEAALTANGFQVDTLIDADFKAMRSAVKDLADKAKGKSVALLYFAGHGVQVEGVNYLIAKDTPVGDELDVQHGALSLDEAIDRMESTNAHTNIIILDACRDNPWDRKWRGQLRGLAPVYAPKGTLIAFSTSPGQVASDGTGRNGAYTEALLAHLASPDLPIETMFKRVRNSLSAATNGKQISWEHTSLAGEFFFNLSISAQIDDYSPAAIRDKTFILDEARLSHRTIAALKTYSWYSQNPALDTLDIQKLSKTHVDNLFVLGRNILQAAEGGSKSAVDWIKRFTKHTSPLPSPKRKALLDGMLFEIFFDSVGEARLYPKVKYFNEVFDLQQVPGYQPSFDFIASLLAPRAANFFALPGKGIAHSVDVKVNSEREVISIFVSGKDHLAIEDDFLPQENEKLSYRSMQRERFDDELAQAMLVPLHLLKIVYSRDVKDSEDIRVPYGFKILGPNEMASKTPAS